MNAVYVEHFAQSALIALMPGIEAIIAEELGKLEQIGQLNADKDNLVTELARLVKVARCAERFEGLDVQPCVGYKVCLLRAHIELCIGSKTSEQISACERIFSRIGKIHVGCPPIIYIREPYLSCPKAGDCLELARLASLIEDALALDWQFVYHANTPLSLTYVPDELNLTCDSPQALEKLRQLHKSFVSELAPGLYDLVRTGRDKPENKASP